MVLLFVHIPKAAGTTLREIVARQYPAGSVFTTGIEEPEARSIDRLRAMPVEERARLRVVQGHFGYGMHELFSDARYMTMLRDPVDRAVSFYAYARQIRDGRFGFDGDWPTLKEFVQDRVKLQAFEIDNGQVRQLTQLRLGEAAPTGERLEEAKRNLERFAAVGISERFDESLKTFAREFGWTDVSYVRRNVSQNRPQLDPPTRTAIEEASQLDLELYDHARSLTAH